MSGLRGLTSELRLHALDLGFVPAIRQCADAAAERGDLSVRITAGLTIEPTDTIAAVVYRNVPEALTNIVKQAPGALVQIEIRDAGDELAVSVCEEGRASPRTAV